LLLPPQNLPSEAKSGLTKRIDEKKQELDDLLRQMEGEYSLENDHKEMQQMLQRSTLSYVADLYLKLAALAISAGAVTAVVGYESYDFVFRRNKENS
jgi:hypothetical protein